MTNASPAPAALQPGDRLGPLDVGYWAWYGGWWAKQAQGGPTRGVDAAKARRPSQLPLTRRNAQMAAAS